eukprot:scaffold906_cov50-Phaeocystis_antarctica.AAC.2
MVTASSPPWTRCTPGWPSTYGYSHHYTRLQPLSHTVAASVAYGCSLCRMRLQPLPHTVAGRERAAAARLSPAGRGGAERRPRPADPGLPRPAHRRRPGLLRPRPHA